MIEQITLCAACVSDHFTAGYTLTPDYNVNQREPCEVCGRMGWTYWIDREHYGKGVGEKILRQREMETV